MSTEMITCPQCGSQMPANAQFCPECGKANAAYTPVPASPKADTPQGGTPTVNIGASPDYGQYSPPAYQPAWEPGQYNARTEAPDLSAPSQSASPAQLSQWQPNHAPPPGPQYGAPTQGFPQYGTQPPPVQPYSNYPAPPINYVNQPQIGVAGNPPRDPTIALLLELLGYVGFLGIGHIYAGRVGRGIALLFAWWAYWCVTILLFIVLIGFCFALLGLALPILSGFWIKNELDKEKNSRIRQGYQ